MALGNITGKPGVLTSYTATPRELFYNNRLLANFIPGPVTVDGTASGNAQNDPYSWLLFAGMPMGRVTSSGKYATSIIGLTTASALSSATSFTVSTAAAKELVRRIGSSGSCKIVSPPSAGGTVATLSVTYSAVNTSTGVVTCSALSAAVISGAIVAPADGSQTPVTLTCDPYGLKVIDAVNTTRVDVFDAQLWAGGGIVNTGMIVDYPSDTSLIAWLKAAIRTNVPDAKFSDDLINP